MALHEYPSMSQPGHERPADLVAIDDATADELIETALDPLFASDIVQLNTIKKKALEQASAASDQEDEVERLNYTRVVTVVDFVIGSATGHMGVPNEDTRRTYNS